MVQPHNKPWPDCQRVLPDAICSMHFQFYCPYRNAKCSIAHALATSVASYMNHHPALGAGLAGAAGEAPLLVLSSLTWESCSAFVFLRGKCSGKDTKSRYGQYIFLSRRRFPQECLVSGISKEVDVARRVLWKGGLLRKSRGCACRVKFIFARTAEGCCIDVASAWVPACNMNERDELVCSCT